MGEIEDLTEQEMKEAQERLNVLCDEYSQKRFELNITNARGYKELIHRMIGLTHKPKGRPREFSDEQIFRIGNDFECIKMFSNIDSDGEILDKKTTAKEATEWVVKNHNLQPKPKADGSYTKPENTVRKIYRESYQKRQKMYRIFQSQYCYNGITKEKT